MKKENKILTKIYGILVAVFFFAFAFAGGVLFSASLLSGFFNPHEAIIGIVGIFLIAYLSLILHEAGHLLFGLMCGYGFSSFRIGSLMWINQGGKINLRRLSIAGTGGQCLMTPPEKQESRAQIIIYNLGGVFVNIILSAIFALMYYLSLKVVLLALVFLFGAIVSFFFALTNGIPMNVGGIANDGMNALHLSKNPDAAEAFRKQLLMNAAQAAGICISEMPDEWFTLPEGADMQNVHCASLAVFAASRPLDRGDTLGAEEDISTLLSSDYNIIGLHRSLLTCDLIYSRLMNNPEADVSSLITPELKKLMQSMCSYPSVIRTQYVIALFVEKDEKKADKIFSEFDKKTKKFPYQQEIDGERNLMFKAAEMFKNKI